MKSSKHYSLGRIVMYVCTNQDKEAQRGAGNVADILPAVIVSTFEHTSYENDEVNLKVWPDGQGDLWRTSVPHDQETKAPGTWHWPELKEYINVPPINPEKIVLPENNEAKQEPAKRGRKPKTN